MIQLEAINQKILQKRESQIILDNSRNTNKIGTYKRKTRKFHRFGGE